MLRKGKQWVILIILVVMPNSVFGWPWDQKKEKETREEQATLESKIESLKKAVKEKGAVGPLSALSFTKRPEKDSQQVAGKDTLLSGTEKTAARRPEEKKADTQAEKRKKEQRAALRAARLAQQQQTLVAAQRAQDLNVAQIQRQIQETVKINDALQANNARQAAEMSRLSEQIRRQQTLLRVPQAPPVTVPHNLTTVDTQEILRQEKIRQTQETIRQQESIRLLSQQTQPAQRVPVVDRVRRNT